MSIIKHKKNTNINIKKGKFTTSRNWIHPIPLYLRCSHSYIQRKNNRQLKITNFLKKTTPLNILKIENNSQNYDADVEMESQDKYLPAHKSNVFTPTGSENIDIELLSVLMENLETKPKKRYNLRKRKVNNSNKSNIQGPIILSNCGKKKINKKKQDENYIQSDFTMMFDKITI